MFRKLTSLQIVAPSAMLFLLVTGSASAQQQNRVDPIKRPNNRTTVTPAPQSQSTILVSRDKDDLRFGGVRISLGLDTTESYAYNPATGEIKPMTGEIPAIVNPIPGVGSVVKIQCPGGRGCRSFVVPLTDGKGELPANADNGNYDLVISIPQSSLPANPRAPERKGVTITFALVKGPDGWGKGTGSPKVAGF